jgi:type 1 fimbriae regulatory protein FimB/type 1 fimbriae regulatory protein FimE
MNRTAFMTNTHLTLVTPTIEKRTVMPRRAKNATLRTREYLTGQEIESLMAAARQNRYGHRDATMILIAFRHGLRGRGRGPSLGPGGFQPRGSARS